MIINNLSEPKRDFIHKAVLEVAVSNFLRVKRGGRYIDATIGGGGHTNAILKSSGIVLGIDLDQDSILHLKKKFESEIDHGKLTLVSGNFADIERLAAHHGFFGVDGILFDLGLSSNQIEKSGRGFSFTRDEPLDMRMDINSKLTAYEIINTWSEIRLYEIFARYGEETNAHKIAQKITMERKKREIVTSLELANIVSEVVHDSGKIHPATKVFQALRIVVNDEINNLKKGIDGGFKLLNEGARFVIISFHSLEDRAVKLEFLKLEREGKGKIITKKPILASQEEVRANRRSRSAKMRVFEKK